ncbi:MAG: BCCT family transporter [Cohaesibacter sp.]|nr:BCCT family transporter [Cohaesibacter sp.]
MVNSDQPNDTPDDSKYRLGQDNVQVLGLDIHNPVFGISAVVIVLFVLLSLLFQESAGAFFGWLRPTMTNAFDWVLLSAANLFVLFSLLLIVTPLGSIRLGGKDAKADYSYAGWFAMLFAAGMGIGLMFFGVSEPLSHYGSSFGGTAMENGVRTDWAPLAGAAGDVEASRQLAMAASIFHWGLHPWAIYSVVALALAFFSYNRGLPLTLRSAFHPLLGDRVWGWPGHLIDILGVFATLFGLATSLGLGAEQALAGLNFLFGWEVNGTNKVLLIIGITIVALISVVAGLEAGVKRLSEINMVLAFGLLIFIFALGPTGFILSGMVENMGAYLKEIVPLSNPCGREDQNFMQGWTAFYWAWWISWAPFVGMFIARVSKGRTVREFVICVLIIPTIVSVLWMSTFGGAAIDQVISHGNEAISAAAQPVKLFEMVKAFPMTELLSLVGIILVIVFFVTSSDSGSLVIDGITAGGKIDAPVVQRVFWAIFEGLIAIALLLGGGLGALQAASVATGVPFTFVLLGMMVAIFVGLRQDYKRGQ